MTPERFLQIQSLFEQALEQSPEQRSALIAHGEFSGRFKREAQAVASLNHPNICQLYDVGPDYLVMEFVEGRPVAPIDSPRKLPDLAVQIADGLCAAHAAGIVHRDLKPDNNPGDLDVEANELWAAERNVRADGSVASNWGCVALLSSSRTSSRCWRTSPAPGNFLFDITSIKL
jgi:serine/threonine protein kinase